MATISSYGPFGPFASPNVAPLRQDEFSRVLSFFKPKQLALLERVCTSWKTCIEKTDQWKQQCQYALNIPTTIDPKTFLPANCSYKDGSHQFCPIVFDGRVYQHYLGANIGSVPPIPKEISLERGGEADPCDPPNAIAGHYVWIYCPKEFEKTADENFPFDLDKVDDPNDEEAPRLIEKETVSSVEKKVLKIPNTINNLGKLFKHPQNGNPSSYDHIEKEIENQHGNKRIPSGWICMRAKPIEIGLSFQQQQESARKAGVVISPLPHRVFFNFLAFICCGTYIDKNDTHFARSSTLTNVPIGDLTTACHGNPYSPGIIINFDCVGFNTGLAVALKESAI